LAVVLSEHIRSCAAETVLAAAANADAMEKSFILDFAWDQTSLRKQLKEILLVRLDTPLGAQGLLIYSCLNSRWSRYSPDGRAYGTRTEKLLRRSRLPLWRPLQSVAHLYGSAIDGVDGQNLENLDVWT